MCSSDLEDEIKRAAQLANLDHVIAAMPEGLDTVIGERGVKLSGGQKQRLSIARMFLKNPPILILDEATSISVLFSTPVFQFGLHGQSL